jgi:4-amino-4-deoxy-L-arabinose transferase-like glycosyltransferase
MTDKPADRFTSKKRPRERFSPLFLLFNKLGPALILLVIFLLGFGLRLYRLGEQNIWWDEGHAVWTARQSMGQVIDITARDVHPPLYLSLLHYWLRWTGESEFTVRYLSLSGGMLTVALTYVVARRLIGRRVALLATLLIATARFHIWWSQEARMYIWATFFGLLSIYFFIRLRYAVTPMWGAYVFASLATLYTLYLAVLILLLENLFVAITVWRKPRRRRFIFNWCLSQLGILVLYTPWLYIALSRTRTDIAKTSFPFRLVWQLYGAVLTTGISTDLDRYTWLLVAFGLLAIAGVALLITDRRQPQRYGFAGWEIGLLLLLPLILPPLVVYALSVPRGIYYSPKPEARYLLLFAPLFYILLAGAMANFWQKGRWGRGVTIVATILVLGTFVSVLPAHYVGRYLRDDYQTAMYTLAAYARPDDAVLVVSGDRYPVFWYHYNRRFSSREGPAVYLLPQHSTRFMRENVETELAPLAARHERIWLASFERTLQDPDNLVEAWLDARLTRVLHVSQGYNYLRLYDTEQRLPTVELATLAAGHSLDQSLDGNVLVGYDLPTTEFRPGDVVKPGLYVQTDEAFDLAVEWIDAEERVIERQTMSVPAGERGTQVVRSMPAFAVYEYTAPGHYWIDVYAVDKGTDRIRLPTGRVTQSRRLPGANIAVRQEAQVDDGRIQFLGYRLSPSGRVRAGDTLSVELYWQAGQALDRDYTAFVHLLGPFNVATGGPVWAQDDSPPLGGGHPMTRWLPKQVIPDRHRLRIPDTAPPGPYQIEVGFYDVLTGKRLSVSGSAEDRILLDQTLVINKR